MQLQQHLQKMAVVVGELPGQRLDQVRDLGAHPAPGQLGERPRVALPGHQRVQHRPAGDSEQVAGPVLLVRELDAGILQQLLDLLAVPGALGDQGRAQPGEVAQLPDRGGRHERSPQHPALGQLGQPHRVELVSLRTARHVLHIPGVDQPHPQAPGLEPVEERAPVIGRRFHHHQLNTLAHQVVGQLHHGVAGRPHRPGPLHPPPGTPPRRQPGAHHRRGLGDVNRRHPHDPLILAEQFDDFTLFVHTPNSFGSGPPSRQHHAGAVHRTTPGKRRI